MDDNDPISQFFPDQEDVDLYAVLSVTRDAKTDEIKKAYRRLALLHHPDKHANASEDAKKDASTRFQQIGFAYTILSDEKRKQRYDITGKTDEGLDLAAGEDGWDAYFEELFDRVTRGKLDEMKKEYQGSTEEVEDLKKAYLATDGSIGDIMTRIPHSTHEDEARFIVIITGLISKHELKSTSTWKSSTIDEKAKLVRQKQSKKEAKEAEKLAKELGVWDEFYGSGKTEERKKKGKGKERAQQEGEEDYSSLQALILKKKQRNINDLADKLAAKYADPPRKGKKRGRDADEVESPNKKSREAPYPGTPDIDDKEFAELQEKLFGDKDSGIKAKPAKNGRGKKTK